MSAHAARTRLRAVIGDYHHATDTDGDHFATAAELLTVIVRTQSTRAAVLDAITDAIEHTDDVAVLSLLHNARQRVSGDLVDIGRRGNDAINARTTDNHHPRSA